jgi:amino acid transporter
VADAEERDRRQTFRDRVFELQKHISTLSTAASLLILAVYRERPFGKDLLAITLVLMAVTAVVAVYGMTVIALDEHPSRWYRRDPDTFELHIHRIANISSSVLVASVVAFALYLFDIPFWIAVGVLIVLLVVILLLLRRRRREAARF